ncbi:hypothetical protein V2646_14115, partial [Tenacibaculum maritimum]
NSTIDSNKFKRGIFNLKTSKSLIDKVNSILNTTKVELSNLYNEIPKERNRVEQKLKGIVVKNENLIKPIRLKIKERDKIEAIENSLKSEKEKLSAIEKIDTKIKNELIKSQEHTKKKLLEYYKEAYDEYVKIIELLNKRGEDFSDIELIGAVKFNYSRFRNNFYLSFFNLSSTANKDLKTLSICKENVEGLPDVVFEKHMEEIKNTFNKIVNDEFVLKKYKEKKDCVKALLKDDFFDYWELKVGNDEMANMSPGKANLVILKLLIELSEANSPILIDQPEDNLDNRSIYNDLVQFIRRRKEDRQMLIVSHNPNVVVATDSENIIIANQKDQDKDRENLEYRFEYINGAIEDTFRLKKKESKKVGILESMGIREHITDLLEGGEEAFKKREEKYGF